MSNDDQSTSKRLSMKSAHSSSIYFKEEEIKRTPMGCESYSYDERDSVISPSLGQLLSTVIDDAIDQLYILGAGMVPQADIRIDNIQNRAMEYVADDPIFDRETGDPFEVSFQKKKLMKLFFDSSKIVCLLTELKNELRYGQDYTALTNFLNEIRRSKVEEMDLFNEEKSNLEEMNNLKQKLLCEQRDNQEHIHVLNEEIAILKDQAEDVLFENLIRTRYIDNWENARIEQNELTCSLKEKELQDTIAQYKNEIEKEVRINTEIEAYIAENQRDMEEAIDEWGKKYEKNSESRFVEIAVYKEKREDLEVEFKILKETYELHQQQIDAYLEHKDRKRKEQEELDRLNAAATKIQAWWRGLMVRRQLGPFNPNYGKKKAKDKKGKGKKKKK